MSRIARQDLQTQFLHVITQGINKEYIFDKEEYIKKYLNLMQTYNKEYKISILSYCIMNNHTHMLIHTSDIAELAKFMHKVNGVYAQYYNKMQERCGVVFINRYKTEPIYKIEHLIHCIKYIHMNPVKANMVKKCEDYPYSSYNEYINNKGLSKQKILLDVLGDIDYKEAFKTKSELEFCDIDKITYEKIQNDIEKGIIIFEEQNKITLGEIFSNRKELKKLIKFLKYECKISYENIMKKFEITKGIMERLKR